MFVVKSIVIQINGQGDGSINLLFSKFQTLPMQPNTTVKHVYMYIMINPDWFCTGLCTLSRGLSRVLFLLHVARAGLGVKGEKGQRGLIGFNGFKGEKG